MTGWVQTLDGSDVYESGDGWVWFPREQGWRWEPSMLTMPKAPFEVRVQNEAHRLSTGWPGLRAAWLWKGPANGGFVSHVLRVWVLLVFAYEALHGPALVKAIYANLHQFTLALRDTPGWANDDNDVASNAQEIMFAHVFFLGISCCFALFIIWHRYLLRVDKHKAYLVSGLIIGASILHTLATRRREQWRYRDGSPWP